MGNVRDYTVKVVKIVKNQKKKKKKNVYYLNSSLNFHDGQWLLYTLFTLKCFGVGCNHMKITYFGFILKVNINEDGVRTL